jgi:polyhydroxyalkanoate synthesis regulator phasin
MSEERKKVLEMLAAGKITAEEAEKLLDKLNSNASNATQGTETPAASAAPATAKPKYLRIVVDQAGRDPVNVRVPLSFLGSAKSLLAILPKRVNERLAENAGSFATMNLEDLGPALRELNVEVNRGGREKVHIFCE